MTEIILRNKEEFKKLLDNYQISKESAEKLKDSRMVVFSGLAASGRNSLINKLVETGNYHFLISDTTRPPKFRDGKMEQDGVNYHFISEEQFLDNLQQGRVIEAELIHSQQVSGTTVKEVLYATELNKIALAELEYKGVNNVAKANPGATIIGLIPPSYDEWTYRLTKREEISESELRNRLETAKKVLENFLEKPYFKMVINDDLDMAVQKVRKIIEDGVFSDDEQAKGIEVVSSILSRLNQEMNKS